MKVNIYVIGFRNEAEWRQNSANRKNLHIADVKCKWRRPKDLEDLKLIDEFIGDNALKDLNKELDSLIKPVPAPEKKEEDNDLPF